MAGVHSMLDRNVVDATKLLFPGNEGRIPEAQSKMTVREILNTYPSMFTKPLVEGAAVKLGVTPKQIMDAVPQAPPKPGKSSELEPSQQRVQVADASGQTVAQAPQAPPASNLEQATKDMNLSPQERALYQRHLDNLNGPGGVDNPDGSRSSLKQITVESDGKTYSIPTVYDGKIVSNEEAIKRAGAEGFDKFPSYATEQEAQARYDQLHGYMDKDTGQYMAAKGGPQSQGVTPGIAKAVVDAVKPETGTLPAPPPPANAAPVMPAELPPPPQGQPGTPGLPGALAPSPQGGGPVTTNAPMPVQTADMSTPLLQASATSTPQSPFSMWQPPIPWDTLQGWGWGGSGGGGFDTASAGFDTGGGFGLGGFDFGAMTG
jgi:hypothetical protein